MLLRISNRVVILAIVAITIFLLPVVCWTNGNIRIALSLVALLLFPGYALLSALFPTNNSISSIERIALSFGVSLAIVSVSGLLIHVSPLELGLNSILIITVIIILFASAIAWYRNARTASERRLSFSIRLFLPEWSRQTRLDRMLTLTLAIVLVTVLGVAGYAAAVPDEGEFYTEFYILDAQGSTSDYPGNVFFGEPIDVIVGVISHEKENTKYQIKIEADGTLLDALETDFLVKDEKWEKQVSFYLPGAGNDQKIEFWLYRQGEAQPCNGNPLSIMVDVVEKG